MRYLKILSLLFLSFFIFLNNFSSLAIASEYSLKVKESEEYVWKVSFIDSEEIGGLGIDRRLEEGMEKKIHIESIEEKSSKWEIDAVFWSYTTNKSSEGKENTYSIDMSPEDDDIGSWIVPTPVEEYLADIEEDFSSDQEEYISIEDDYSIKIEIDGDDLYYTYEYDMQTGLLSALIYYKDGAIVYKSELNRMISGFDSFLIISFIFAFGLIILVKSRNTLFKKQ